MDFIFPYDLFSSQLTYLEDPAPGEAAEDILVSLSAAKSLDRYCRGGEHCCQRDNKNLCKEGKGDCNSDLECEGLLECGNNNCDRSGGLWDSEDDCCQRRCTSERPCDHGKVSLGVRMSNG